MKHRKRLIVYSLLALPFIVFVIFFLTLDPRVRAGFLNDLGLHTVKQFGYGVDPRSPAGVEGSASRLGDEPATAGGQAGGAGFDPAQFFAERDTDGDGKLTGDEIGERMRENLDQTDTNGDGSITLEEMQAWMADRRGRGGANGGGDPNRMFTRRDENGDGKLTGDEIGERLRENMANIDTDQDGAITLEEIVASVNREGDTRESSTTP